MPASALPDDLPPNCTFDASDWRLLAGCWFAVALVRDLDSGPVAAILLDQRLIVYRADGQVVVANDLCPHRGVPLSLGASDEGGVSCAYHGLKFGAGGRCIRVPSSPDMAIPDRLNLAAYPAVERYGLIWTCLRPHPGAEPAIPPMPHWEAPGFQQINCPHFDIAGFAGRQVEGFIDVAHFAYIHVDTFADPDNEIVPSYMVTPHANGFVADYRSSVGNYAAGANTRNPPGFEWLRRFEVHAPFTATLTIHFPDDGRLVIMNAASPVSARKTRLFVPIARNFDTHLPVQDVYEFNLRVFKEDAAMVEAQRPENLPLDPKREAHIPADRSSIAYRRTLREMGFNRFFAA